MARAVSTVRHRFDHRRRPPLDRLQRQLRHHIREHHDAGYSNAVGWLRGHHCGVRHIGHASVTGRVRQAIQRTEPAERPSGDGIVWGGIGCAPVAGESSAPGLDDRVPCLPSGCNRTVPGNPPHHVPYRLAGDVVLIDRFRGPLPSARVGRQGTQPGRWVLWPVSHSLVLR